MVCQKLAVISLAFQSHSPMAIYVNWQRAPRTQPRFAQEVMAPKVAQMDAESKMCSELIQGLFDNGLMGVEVPAEMGGTGSSFMASILVVEEIAKVDPAVAVLVDSQNTLINNVMRFWASEKLQEEWLPKLATDTVGSFCLSEAGSGSGQ